MRQLAGCSAHPEPDFRTTRVWPELPQYSQLGSHQAPPRAPPPGRPDIGEVTGLDEEIAETLADPAAAGGVFVNLENIAPPSGGHLALPHSASPCVSFLPRGL